MEITYSLGLLYTEVSISTCHDWIRKKNYFRPSSRLQDYYSSAVLLKYVHLKQRCYWKQRVIIIIIPPRTPHNGDH